MPNLQEYGLWLALVTINAVIVSQWINYLTLISARAAGLCAGLFLSIFLGSLMFILIRSVMSWLHRRQCQRILQATKAEEVVSVA